MCTAIKFTNSYVSPLLPFISLKKMQIGIGNANRASLSCPKILIFLSHLRWFTTNLLLVLLVANTIFNKSFSEFRDE